MKKPFRFDLSASNKQPKAGDAKMINGVLHVRQIQFTESGGGYALSKKDGEYQTQWVKR